MYSKPGYLNYVYASWNMTHTVCCAKVIPIAQLHTYIMQLGYHAVLVRSNFSWLLLVSKQYTVYKVSI